jgi:hypothetical protein
MDDFTLKLTQITGLSQRRLVYQSMQFEMRLHQDAGEFYQHCNQLLPVCRPLLVHANPYVQTAEATHFFPSLKYTVVSVVKLGKS